MPLAEATSLLADTEPLVAPLDVAADLAELRRLAVLFGRFGPVAGIEEATSPESILVDVTGCDTFFGGENSLAREAVALARSEGYAARAGLADTVGLAWAATRAAGSPRIQVIPTGSGERWLSRHKVTLLRLDDRTTKLLEKLGIRTMGELLRLPRTELPSRFGPNLLRRLDQALGHRLETIEPVREVEPLRAQWSSEFPLVNRPALEVIVTRLLDSLLSRLSPWEAISRLTCRFREQAGPVVRPTKPSRSAERLLELWRLSLDRDRPPKEIHLIVLTAETVALPSAIRTSLFAEDEDSLERTRAVERLVERLSGRLGEKAVLQPVTTGDPLPERSLRLVPALSQPRDHALQPVREVWAASSRPILLLVELEPVRVWSVIPDGPPFRMTRGGDTFALTIALGPERLETGWSDDLESRRDYWRVETERAERLWIFRCRRSGDWFLHGLFA